MTLVVIFHIYSYYITMMKFESIPVTEEQNTTNNNATQFSQESLCDPIDEFERENNNVATYAEWKKEYGNNPLTFFSPDNLDNLGSMSPGKRMAFFGLSSRNISVSPSDADLYFDTYPDDLEAFRVLISSNIGPQTTEEFSVWSMAAHRVFLSTKDSSNQTTLNPWQKINKRRIEAPKHLLSNGTNLLDEIASFGMASNNISNAIDKASSNPVGLSEILQTRDLFDNDEYRTLDTQSRKKLLSLCLAYLQESLVFLEANNSSFTRESVSEDNSKRRLSKSDYFNAAHSMLFKTYQPSAAYNSAQSVFEYEMNDTQDYISFEHIEEYPFHRIMLAVLDQYRYLGTSGDHDDVDLVVDFWSKNLNPIFANSVADALSAIDGQYASVKLMEHVNDNNDKTAIAAILYRVEFKRIGVSTEGVEYLNKMYDLGALNNPDYFVQRLSTSGEIGVFNQDLELLKYFDVGNLSETEKNIKADVLDFTYNTLFRPHTGETEDEKRQRERYLEEFKKHYFNISDSDIFSGDIRLNNFSFKEQGALLIILNELEQVSEDKLLNLAKTHGESGLKVFLRYYETDPVVATKTLDVISNLPDGIDSHQILELLASISSYISRLDDEFDDIYERSKTYEEEEILEPNDVVIKKTVIPQAKKLILAQVDTIISKIASENVSTPEAIREYIENIKPEAIVVQTILKASRGSFDIANMNEMPFIKNIQYQGGDNETNSAEFVKAIRNLYKKNYQDKPKLLKRLLAGLEVSRKNTRTIFHVAEFDGQPIGYCVFEFEDDGSVHFGKFNIDPDFNGRKVGEQMLEETLDDYAVMHIVKAECDRNTKIAAKYIEKGFIAYNEYPLDEIACWDIVRNDSINNELVTKSLDESYILDHMVMNSWETLGLSDNPEDAMVYATTASDYKSYTLNLASFGEGYAVTRMFREKTTGSEELVILVVEKLGEKLERYRNDFQLPQMIETRHAIII